MDDQYAELNRKKDRDPLHNLNDNHQICADQGYGTWMRELGEWKLL